MNKRWRVVLIPVAVGVVGFLSWFGYQRLHAGPRDRFIEQISTMRAASATYEEGLARARQLDRRLQATAETALARDPDRVRHHFRVALAALASEAGLIDVSVSDARPAALANPASKARIERPLGPKLADQRDAAVVRGQLRGSGGLDACLTAIAAAQAQPWIHRVEGYSIRPEGAGRERFEFRLDVATLFFSDLGPAGDQTPVVFSPDPGALAALSSIAQANPFLAPPPPAVVVSKPAPAPRQAPPPKPPGPAPDSLWRLVGVVRTDVGMEAWLTHTRTSERRVLASGDELLDLRFVAGDGESAIFEREGRRFALRTGQTLAQRRPAG
ncbi:MAG: hypothetical protein AAF138_08255 [Planctomycetota bacterium]